MPVRIPVVAAVAAVGLTLGLVVSSLLSGAAGPPQVSRPASSAVSLTGPPGVLGVLQEWDRRRAAAWAAGDVEALARLYTRGSSAGLADVALLREYAARGLVVRGLRMQLLRARVLVARPRRLELEVTDRLSAASAVRATDPTASWRLPVDAATTRMLELRRVGERWLMARVSVRR